MELSELLDAAYATPPAQMSEGERLTRAREAWIGAHQPFRWIARRVRAGKLDHRLRGILFALEDLGRPMAAIVADRDEATCALIMRTSPGMPSDLDARRAIAAALLTAVRIGRRG